MVWTSNSLEKASGFFAITSETKSRRARVSSDDEADIDVRDRPAIRCGIRWAKRLKTRPDGCVSDVMYEAPKE